MIVTLAFAVSASASGPKVMNLNDCMKYAISSSTKMKIQQAESDDARIDRRIAALSLFSPQISAQTSAYYNFGRSIDPQTNTYFNTTSFHNNYGVSAGYDLFNGFQAVNNYRISKTGMQIAESLEDQVEADICLAVMEAYYNVLYYKNLVAVYETQAEVAAEVVKKARRQEELGQKGHADVVQMEADLADCQFNLINTRNTYKSQKMILEDLMFWPMDQELQLAEVSLSSVAEDGMVSGADGGGEASVVSVALENSPVMKIAVMRQENAQLELTTAKWQLAPSVGVYAGWSTSYYNYQGTSTDAFNSQFQNNGGEYVELTVSIPIWNRLNRASKISKRRNAYLKASAEVEQRRREVESEVRRAVQDCEDGASAYLQARYRAEVQAEAYRLNMKKMDQGLISPIEFQTASNNYLKAQSDMMGSMFKYLIKRAVVKYYNGVNYIEQ
ncbi:MAG: TolC family protein [Bacteroidales bacterium]|nr:TolC family protein [Bacteroidales bacterium]